MSKSQPCRSARRRRDQEPDPAADEDDDLRAFDPYRYAAGAAAHKVIEAALAAVAANEHRTRARKGVDKVRFLATAEAILMDAAHAYLAGLAGIRVSRSKATFGALPARYSAPALNRGLPQLLDTLQRAGLIDQQIGDKSRHTHVFTDQFGETRPRMQTTIAASASLQLLIKHSGLAFADIGHDPAHAETVLLKEPKRYRLHTPKLIDYRDNDTTRRYRAELLAINKALAGADLSLAESLPHIDLGERHLQRTFTRGSFESGGRLFGGFWLPMSKDERLRYLRIDGEAVASLDFKSMYAALAYGRAGVPPPAGDLYALPGVHPKYRPGIKRLVSARLFDQGPRKSKPRRTPKEVRDGVELFPPGMALEELQALLDDVHQPIVPLFGSGIGHAFQFVESEMMVRLLLEGAENNITILPVHDCCVCRCSAVETVRVMMIRTSAAVAGRALDVEVSTAASLLESAQDDSCSSISSNKLQARQLGTVGRIRP